jgi:hypothetical protein
LCFCTGGLAFGGGGEDDRRVEGASQPAGAAKPRDPRAVRALKTGKADFLAGLSLAALVALIVLGERLDEARGTIEAMRAATDAHGARPDVLPIVWGVATAAGLGVALFVGRRIVEEATTHRSGDRAIWLLKRLGIGAVVFWTLWQATGVVALAGVEAFQKPRPLLHGIAILLSAMAVGGVAGSVIGGLDDAWKRASAVRIQLIVLAALFALVFLVPVTSAQLFDVLRAWADPPLGRALAGVGGALLLGAVCRASAGRLLTPEDHATKIDAGRSTLEWVVLAVLLAAAVALAIAGAVAGWVAAGTACLIGLASKRALPPAPGAGEEEVRRRLRRLAGTLSVVPLATVYAGLVGATVDSFLLPDRSDSDFILLVITGIVGALLALLAGNAHRPSGATVEELREAAPGFTLKRWGGWLIGAYGVIAALLAALIPSQFQFGLDWVCSVPLLIGAIAIAFRLLGEHGAPELWGGAGVAIGTAIGVYADPIGAPRALGAFAVVMIGTAGILLILHGLASVGSRRKPLNPLRLSNPRLPVVALIAVWIAVATLWPAESAHQARTVTGEAKAPAPLGEAVSDWLDAAPRDPGSPYIPMVLVAASGGGSKASYWTDLVLDCMLGKGAPHRKAAECDKSDDVERRLGRVFLTSSVSGGSVGIYHFVEHRDDILAGRTWVDTAAGPEVLSPVTGWGLFHDLPAFMLGVKTDPRKCHSEAACRLHADRAVVQEAAVADDGVVPGRENGLRHAGTKRPITVFNGAVDGGNSRLLASPLALAPPRSPDPDCNAEPSERELEDGSKEREPAAGSLDAADLLPRAEDVPLITAALLSARFPVIAPAARVGDQKASKTAAGSCDAKVPLPPVKVRDGGYIENTGLLTIVDLLPTIQNAIARWKTAAPDRADVHVQIMVVSIDDDPAVLEPAPQPGDRPSEPLGIAKPAGPGYLSRLARDRLSSCQYEDVTYLRISPPPAAGAHAATGWELSETTRREDLAGALRQGRVAKRRVQTVRDVLSGASMPENCAPVK